MRAVEKAATRIQQRPNPAISNGKAEGGKSHSRLPESFSTSCTWSLAPRMPHVSSRSAIIPIEFIVPIAIAGSPRKTKKKRTTSQTRRRAARGAIANFCEQHEHTSVGTSAAHAAMKPRRMTPTMMIELRHASAEPYSGWQ